MSYTEAPEHFVEPAEPHGGSPSLCVESSDVPGVEMSSHSRGDDRPRNDALKTSSRKVKRRSSKRSSTVDRQGIVFSDSDQDTTIRVVTPEPRTVSARKTHSRESEEPRSPKSRSHIRREHSASVSNTDDEGTIESRRRDRPSNAGDLPSDASPSSLMSKTRQRLGSLATSSAFTSRPADFFSSIGVSFSVTIPSATQREDATAFVKNSSA